VPYRDGPYRDQRAAWEAARDEAERVLSLRARELFLAQADVRRARERLETALVQATARAALDPSLQGEVAHIEAVLVALSARVRRIGRDAIAFEAPRTAADVEGLEAKEAVWASSDGLLKQAEDLAKHIEWSAVVAALQNLVDGGMGPSDPGWTRFRSNVEGLRECVRRIAALVSARSPSEHELLRGAWEDVEAVLDRARRVLRICDERIEQT
jgi:hypothetical protein